MRHDNGGPQLLEPTASRLNRPTVQVQCLFPSGAEANPLFLGTLELALEILEIVLEILETVLEILGIVLPCNYFQFQGQKDILRETPGKPGQDIAKPNDLSSQCIPAQSVAVILSIAPGFSSTASSQRKIWNDGATRRIPKSHIKNMLARQRLLRQQKV